MDLTTVVPWPSMKSLLEATLKAKKRFTAKFPFMAKWNIMSKRASACMFVFEESPSSSLPANNRPSNGPTPINHYYAVMEMI